jgi:primosomal protein N' (replication factor Y) (superfamily II helicase)
MSSHNNPTIYRIAVPSPLRRLFDYLPPATPVETNTNSTNRNLLPGTRVMIPFGHRKVVGIVVSTTHKSDFPLSRLKAIDAVLDSEPLVPPHLFELYIWAARYYQHPIGDALINSLPSLLRKGEPIPTEEEKHWQLTDLGKGLPETALKRAPKQQQILNLLQQQNTLNKDTVKRLVISPSALKQLKEKNIIESVTRPISNTSDNHQENLLAEQPLELYPEQQQALDGIELHGFNPYLLYGETGSGKTEVYLQAIEKILRYGKQALILIPEISLTPQTLSRFEQRFNCPIALLHSGLTDRERALAWNAARTGQAPIVLGTRSAIFTPLKSPGLIIVDEEHDSSFKQQEGFRYSARDLSVIRAKKESIPLILGSATPSLESLYNCEQNRYTQLMLSCRPGNAVQPSWQPVDIRKSKLSSGYSRELIEAITQTLAAGSQVLVFLNRRGFAPTLSCHECGWISDCHRCEARLTVHRNPNRLLCHHCEHMEPVPVACPFCHSAQLQCIGQGTERSEEILDALFPDTTIIRVDRDTTRRKHAMKEVVAQVNRGEPCILIGTQLLAKGHHFPNVTLVAILDADGGLFSPDFRAPEKMGQLITQVAGRSGRGDKPGTVILQSHHCDHPLIATLTHSGYKAFSQELIKERQLAQLPPYRHMALIRAEAVNSEAAIEFLKHCRQSAERLLPASSLPTTNSVSYLGPLPAPMERRSGRFRHQFSITCAERSTLQRLMTTLCQELEQSQLAKRVRWSVDIDPQDMT